MRFRSATAVAALCTGILVLGGCTGDPAPEPDAPPAPVLVPGRPGEQAEVVPPEQAAERAERPQPNDADTRYMTMMIPHHRQAIVMTDLIAERAGDERVRAMGGRIAASQDAEIALMSAWLIRYGKPVPPEAGRHGDRGLHSGHTGHEGHASGGHELMPGMATAEQLAELKAAGGPEFDRLFLELMITHHEGALTMARRELAEGREQRALEMAQDVLAGQAAEIGRMHALRDG